MTLERGLPWKQDDPTCKNSFFLFLILLPCERGRQQTKTVWEQTFLISTHDASVFLTIVHQNFSTMPCMPISFAGIFLH